MVTPLRPGDVGFAAQTDASSRSSLTEKYDIKPDRPLLGAVSDGRGEDPDAIATQPSVFDEPGWEAYAPPPQYENAHRFDPDHRWTWREERKLVRKIDLRIFVWACVMFFGLELDRSNIQQANSANLLPSLRLTTADYNLGNTLFRLSFLCAELPSQMISKWIGPDRWIPAQLCMWSIVSASQFWLTGRGSFLATRALIGLIQGGFIPDIVLWLSYFYTNAELPMRLAGFWTTMYLADIFSAFIAVPILKLDGHRGQEGWRWLFLLEGLFTLGIGLVSWFMMPASVSSAKNIFRPKGYFTETEEKTIVNKVLRDQPSKSDMHNRQRLTFRRLWNALTDYYVWPLYLIGLLFGLPSGPATSYLTLTLRGLGFSTTATNLLTVPAYSLNIIFLLAATWLSERFKKRALLASFQVFYTIPLLIALISFTRETSPWSKYVVTMLIVGHPYSHAIQVAWVSRNANSVGDRTVNSAVYNMFVQASAIIISQCYQPYDAPLYKVGNSALLGVAVFAFAFYGAVWLFYTRVNERREAKWSAMTPSERADYARTTTDQRSKRLDFRFAT